MDIQSKITASTEVSAEDIAVLESVYYVSFGEGGLYSEEDKDKLIEAVEESEGCSFDWDSTRHGADGEPYSASLYDYLKTRQPMTYGRISSYMPTYGVASDKIPALDALISKIESIEG